MASDGIWEKTDDGNDTITSQEAYKTFKDLGSLFIPVKPLFSASINEKYL